MVAMYTFREVVDLVASRSVAKMFSQDDSFFEGNISSVPP